VSLLQNLPTIQQSITVVSFKSHHEINEAEEIQLCTVSYLYTGNKYKKNLNIGFW